MERIFILACAFAMLLLEGCATTNVVSEYKASAVNVKNIKGMYAKTGTKVKIAHLTSKKSEEKSVMCRLAGPISAPNDSTFELYIIDALKSEMKFAGIYEHKSKISLKIRFDEINFDSSEGKWIINSKVSAENKNSFNIKSEYGFDASFLGGMACAQVSAAFPKAVEKYINSVISHPEVVKIINGR